MQALSSSIWETLIQIQTTQILILLKFKFHLNKVHSSLFKIFKNSLCMCVCVFTHVCGYPKNVEKNVPRVTGESELGVTAGNEPSITAARNQINHY